MKANLGQREAEKSYGITGNDLTPSLSWSLYALRKDWNAAKDTVAPWWRECSKEAFNTGLDQLARALKNWGDSRTGKRKGKPAGFPRFKSKRKGGKHVRVAIGVEDAFDDRVEAVVQAVPGRLIDEADVRAAGGGPHAVQRYRPALRFR